MTRSPVRLAVIVAGQPLLPELGLRHAHAGAADAPGAPRVGGLDQHRVLGACQQQRNLVCFPALCTRISLQSCLAFDTEETL